VIFEQFDQDIVVMSAIAFWNPKRSKKQYRC